MALLFADVHTTVAGFTTGAIAATTGAGPLSAAASMLDVLGTSDDGVGCASGSGAAVSGGSTGFFHETGCRKEFMPFKLSNGDEVKGTFTAGRGTGGGATTTGNAGGGGRHSTYKTWPSYLSQQTKSKHSIATVSQTHQDKQDHGQLHAYTCKNDSCVSLSRSASKCTAHGMSQRHQQLENAGKRTGEHTNGRARHERRPKNELLVQRNAKVRKNTGAHRTKACCRAKRDDGLHAQVGWQHSCK
jgi:hypothetical protein